MVKVIFAWVVYMEVMNNAERKIYVIKISRGIRKLFVLEICPLLNFIKPLFKPY